MEKFRTVVERYQYITIFHHENGDFDCIGSALGLKYLLQATYPEKKIVMLGDDYREIAHYFHGEDQHCDQLEDQFIAQSLAIVVDTANRSRIDDQRFTLAQEIVKIDHHLVVDPYGDYQYVVETASATSEVLYQLLEANGYQLTERAATYLYMSLVGDNISYSTSNTSAYSLYVGSRLAEHLPSVSEIVQKMRMRSFATYQMETLLRQKISVQGDFAYLILPLAEFSDPQFTPKKLKCMVNIMANITEITKWAIFAEVEPQVYEVSVRSRCFNVNQVAVKYGGGGHRRASGFKGLPEALLSTVIQELSEVADD